MKFSKYNLFIDSEEDDRSYLLFNTLTGATFRIDEETKQQIELSNYSYFDEKKINEYKHHGIIVEKHISEERYFSYLHNKQKYSNEVLSVTVLLTLACNLKCIYCFQGAGLTYNGSLNEETRENIYHFLTTQAEQRKSKVISLVLFGGEPLLNFKANTDWLDKLKKFCDETDRVLETSVVTNGVLVTDEILDNLKAYNCKSIQITLDGVKEIHDTRRIYKSGKGSFDEVISGIKKIAVREDFNNPVIRINIDKNNILETNSLLKYLADEGLKGCYIDFGIVKGGTAACASYAGHCFVDEELGTVLENLWLETERLGFDINTRPSNRFVFCGLYCDASFTIAPNGDLYKCWEHVSDERHLIGRITTQGEVVDTTYAYFDWMSRNPLETEDCRECAYLPVCGGGCGSISYEQEGTYHAKGCFKTKGVLEKQLKLLFKSKANKEHQTV
jgi:uncharacterized protein